MSKENLRKHTSIKNALPLLQRRQSRQDVREQATDNRAQLSTQQSQLSKKIQNKLRLKKRNTNNPPIQKRSVTPPQFESTGTLSNNNLQQPQTNNQYHGLVSEEVRFDIPEEINRIMESDGEICRKIGIARVSVDDIKMQVIRDTTLILCQVNKGRTFQEAVVDRIGAVVDAEIAKRRIDDKEKSILAMMDDRIKKMMILQKPLVH